MTRITLAHRQRFLPRSRQIKATQPAKTTVAPALPVKPVVPTTVPTVPVVVRRRALCIGINYTGSSVALQGCINDQQNVVQTLTSKASFLPSDVVVMNDTATGTGYPSLANIWLQLDALRQWAAQWPSTTSVQLFVSYSGHGTRRPDFSGDEADYYDECIVPIDYARVGFIKDDDLRTRFISLLPANVRLVMLVDSCNSGTVADLRYTYNLSTPLVVSTDIHYPETACTCISLTACMDSQTAADAWLPDPVTGVYESQGGLSSAFCKLFAPSTPLIQLALAMKQWVFAQKLTQQTQLCTSRVVGDTACLFV